MTIHHLSTVNFDKFKQALMFISHEQKCSKVQIKERKHIIRKHLKEGKNQGNHKI